MKHADLVSKLTLEEKCALLSGKDVWHTRDIPRLNIPSITLSDGPSGLRKQAGEGDHLGLNASTKATCIPSAATLACSWDETVAESMGCVVGADAAEQKVDVLLAPGMNTKRSSLCGRSFEYYSEDPYLSGKMAAGFIRGAQSNGISACGKHFAANSQELLRMHSDSVMDERTLREMYLTNFEIAVREGKPGFIMTSYNRVNGVYANESRHLLGDILRGEWGFDGAVVTDWGGSNSYIEGVREGMNLEMPAAGDDSPCQLIKAIKNGEIDEKIVDERVDKLLEFILDKREKTNKKPHDLDRQHEEARAAAEKCLVLLKNDNNALPLDKQAKVAFIGDFVANPRYQGAGSSMVNAAKVDDTSSALDAFFPERVGASQGFERLDRQNPVLAAEAVELAQKADCVVAYLGLPECFETEGLDRSHMRLPDNQLALLKELRATGKKIVVVLSCGSAVETSWVQECDAVLYAGLGGEAVAHAVLRALVGDVNPGGKLAETWYRHYADAPVSHYYPGNEATSEYREGLYVGYRYTETADVTPGFTFGHGLSYTTFKYDNIACDGKSVSFDITNIGNCAGDEVAQLYVHKADAAIFRPAKELKGFKRVHLEKGETKHVSIPFESYTFRYFNVQTKRFEVEGGRYELLIGSSCRDIRLKTMHEEKGTDAPDPYRQLAVESYRTAHVTDVSDAEFTALLGRAIPPHNWDRKKPLTLNDSVSQLCYAKNALARLAYRILTNMKDKAIAQGKPDLNLLFIYYIPFRGMAKMMNGMVSMAMAEDILFIVNGHFFRGCGRLIHHFCHRPKLDLNPDAIK